MIFSIFEVIMFLGMFAVIFVMGVCAFYLEKMSGCFSTIAGAIKNAV